MQLANEASDVSADPSLAEGHNKAQAVLQTKAPTMAILKGKGPKLLSNSKNFKILPLGQGQKIKINSQIKQSSLLGKLSSANS